QYPHWGQLARAIRDGRPVVEPAQHLGGDPEKTRQFVLAMHERAAAVGGRLRVESYTGAGTRVIVEISR
ncbi:MAG: hypothetical protein RMN25_12970, partial [Anaerolineae bacterium]|nr:hypothetical protein [Thermoflexales bacterium]MDW8408684.1 hypothetical protein [Anaerolineae bacterium]